MNSATLKSLLELVSIPALVAVAAGLVVVLGKLHGYLDTKAQAAKAAHTSILRQDALAALAALAGLMQGAVQSIEDTMRPEMGQKLTAEEAAKLEAAAKEAFKSTAKAVPSTVLEAAGVSSLDSVASALLPAAVAKLPASNVAAAAPGPLKPAA